MNEDGGREKLFDVPSAQDYYQANPVVFLLTTGRQCSQRPGFGLSSVNGGIKPAANLLTAGSLIPAFLVSPEGTGPAKSTDRATQENRRT